jgi:hypothetical protein
MMTNIAQATAGGLGDVIKSYEKTRVWISDVPTHSFWFTRFMAGFHRRIGDLKKQDTTISINVVWEADKILEAEWRKLEDWKKDLPAAK